MSEATQETLVGTPPPNEPPVEPAEGASSIREYIVFEEVSPDTFKRIETVSAGSPDSALRTVKPLSENKRYGVVAARYWQVGAPKVKQVTQVSIEFE